MNLLLEKANRGYNFIIHIDDYYSCEYERGNLLSLVKCGLPLLVFKKKKKKLDVFINTHNLSRIPYYKLIIVSALHSLKTISVNTLKNDLLNSIMEFLNSDGYHSKEVLKEFMGFTIVFENKVYQYYINGRILEVYSDFLSLEDTNIKYLYEQCSGDSLRKKVEQLNDLLINERPYLKQISIFCYGNTCNNSMEFRFGEKFDQCFKVRKGDDF